MPKAGSKKRARESSPAVKKKKEVLAEEEETDASAEGEKVAEGSSESAPLMVFAHGAGANSSHEWMVRYGLFC